MKEKQPFSPQRACWKLLCLFLGLVLLLMLCATAGVRYVASQLSFSTPLPQTVPDSPQQVFLEFLDGSDVDWNQLAADVTKKDKDITNLLLIGKDQRKNQTVSRADSILLCSLRKEDNTLVLTSFLRDLYLPIPGHGSDRLNAAYAYGGTPLLKQTLTENFGIPIDGCVEVDFSRFAQLIDALGGVELELRRDEAEMINKVMGSSFTEGTHLLNGDEALFYSRIRILDSDGDFSRTNRQRKVISALVGSYRSASLPTLLQLMKQILPMISTDLSEGKLLMLALDVFPMLSQLEMKSQSIPAPGTFSDMTVDGMSVLSPDMETARKTLQETAGRK